MYSANNIRRIRLVQPFNKDDRKIDDKLPNLPTLTSFKEFAYLFPNNENFEIRRVIPWNETRFTEMEITRILGGDFTTISKDGYVICAIEDAVHKGYILDYWRNPCRFYFTGS